MVFWNFTNQDLVKVFGSCTGIDEFTVKAGDYSVASYKFILVTCDMCFSNNSNNEHRIRIIINIELAPNGLQKLLNVCRITIELTSHLT